MLTNLLPLFSLLFLYFILQVKLRLETDQGAPPQHQTGGNIVNGNLLISASPRARKGGYGKRSAIDPTADNMGVFLPSFFFLFFLTRMPLTFYQPIPHGADCLQTQPPPRRRPRLPPGINITTLNIRDGWEFSMA